MPPQLLCHDSRSGGTFRFHRLGHLTGHGVGGGSRTAGIGEDVHGGKAAFPRKGQGFLQLRLRFAGEAHDEIRGHGAAGEPLAKQPDALQIPGCVVFPAHPLQNGIAAALQAQMKLGTEIVKGRQPPAEVLIHDPWLQRAEADAHGSGGGTDGLRQIGKAAAVLQVPAPGGDLDTRHHYLPVTGLRQCPGLGNGPVEGLGAHGAAGIGDDAVGAEIVAAVLNLQHGAGTLPHPAGRQIFKGSALQGVVNSNVLTAHAACLLFPPEGQQTLQEFLPAAAAGDHIGAGFGSFLRADLGVAAAHTQQGVGMLAAQTVQEGAIFAVGDGGDGAGVDDEDIAVGLRGRLVAQTDELLLHGLGLILVDLAAQGKTVKFHKILQKLPKEIQKYLTKNNLIFCANRQYNETCMDKPELRHPMTLLF